MIDFDGDNDNFDSTKSRQEPKDNSNCCDRKWEGTLNFLAMTNWLTGRVLCFYNYGAI
jgi:hypothetical protein